MKDKLSECMDESIELAPPADRFGMYRLMDWQGEFIDVRAGDHNKACDLAVLLYKSPMYAVRFIGKCQVVESPECKDCAYFDELAIANGDLTHTCVLTGEEANADMFGCFDNCPFILGWKKR